MDAFKAFRNSGVMVFAGSKEEYAKLPDGAKSINAAAGKGIPKVLVTSADGLKGIQGFSSATLKKDASGAAKTLDETLASLGEASDSEADEKTETSDAPLAETQEWTNADGVAMTASVQSVEGNMVNFKMADGRELSYAIDKLSPESQEKIKGLAADQ